MTGLSVQFETNSSKNYTQETFRSFIDDCVFLFQAVRHSLWSAANHSAKQVRPDRSKPANQEMNLRGTLSDSTHSCNIIYSENTE